MARLFLVARENVRGILVAVAASVYFLGFFSAVQAALAKLFY
ncbi:hypothetical protein [Belnapia mucosa]|nr:hypothetical protein [Belnapia mucosa]